MSNEINYDNMGEWILITELDGNVDEMSLEHFLSEKTHLFDTKWKIVKKDPPPFVPVIKAQIDITLDEHHAYWDIRENHLLSGLYTHEYSLVDAMSNYFVREFGAMMEYGYCSIDDTNVDLIEWAIKTEFFDGWGEIKVTRGDKSVSFELDDKCFRLE